MCFPKDKADWCIIAAVLFVISMLSLGARGVYCITNFPEITAHQYTSLEEVDPFIWGQYMDDGKIVMWEWVAIQTTLKEEKKDDIKAILAALEDSHLEKMIAELQARLDANQYREAKP